MHRFADRKNSGSSDTKNSKTTTGGEKDETSAENNEKEEGVKPEDSAEPQASFVDLLV